MCMVCFVFCEFEPEVNFVVFGTLLCTLVSIAAGRFWVRLILHVFTMYAGMSGFRSTGEKWIVEIDSDAPGTH